MPYIPPSVVQEVKRMDSMTYLKNYEPYELVHFSGNTYTTGTHDILKISNGKWRGVEQRDRWQISTGLSDQSKRIQFFRGG